MAITCNGKQLSEIMKKIQNRVAIHFLNANMYLEGICS